MLLVHYLSKEGDRNPELIQSIIIVSTPSCGRFKYCSQRWFQVGEQAKLWKVLVLHILQVPSWRAGQAVEGFSTAHIAGSKLASRPSCGRF